jgi:DNA-binding CsgD family transcriptional regulator
LEDSPAVDIDKTNSCLAMPAPDAERTAALCELLQLLGTAAILVDRDGEVVGLNHAAKDCIGAGLQIRNRRLIAAEPEAKRALAELIGGTRRGSTAPACTGEQVIVLRRHTRPLLLRTIPLHGRAGALFHPASAIVMLVDAGRVSLPTEAHLKSAFGLSGGEARLAIRLGAGETLEAAARCCGISYETARKRLKVVFEKTDTRRQSELVALIIRVGTLAGAVRAASGETMRPQPRHQPINGASPALRQPLRQIQTRPRDTRWKSLSTA